MSARDVAARALAANYRHLGEAAVWFPLVGVKADVTVIPEFRPAGDGFGRGGVAASVWSCRVRAASLAAPSPGKDDRVEFNGVRYRLTEKPRHPDGDGFGLEWLCALEADC